MRGQTGTDCANRRWIKGLRFRLLTFTAVVSFAFALALPKTAMADVIALKIPGILGDLKVVGFEKQIEVMSLSNNILNPVKAGSPGGGGAAGKAVFSDMTIRKRIDTASPALFLAIVTGKHFPNAVLTFVQDSGGSLLAVFEITLTDIVVSKIETDATEKNVLAGQEQIDLNFTKIQLKDELTGSQACFDLKLFRQC
jgi:type VI secretion system secreted protein Hcp